jgi:hypothetical protein
MIVINKIDILSIVLIKAKAYIENKIPFGNLILVTNS